MKLIKPSFEIIEQQPGLEGIYKQIELAGRTCYRSEDKITEDSAEPFVNRMMSNHHLSVLEHGTVYLKIPYGIMDDSGEFSNEHIVIKYIENPYSVVNDNMEDDYWYVTTNYRVLIENNWLNNLEYLCEPTEFHEKRVTVRIICSIGTSREFNRHRTFSISEQSTRYCNFSKDKFGNEVSFIIPSWLDIPEGEYVWEDQNPLLTAGMSVEEAGYDDSSDLWIKDNNGDGYIEYKRHYKGWMETESFMHALQVAEYSYMNLLKLGWKPQQAREVLPLATATEVVYTAFVSDWVHFFSLRCSEAAHPSARELAIPLKEEFIKRGWMNE